MPPRATCSDGSCREGNTTLDVSGVGPRARGLGTRSGRACPLGTFKDATDSTDATDALRGACVGVADDAWTGGAGLWPRCTLRGVPWRGGGTDGARGGIEED
jgi:hypothetical protein